MTYLNLIYFFTLFLFVFKKKKISVSSYVVFIYLFSAVCSIIYVESSNNLMYDTISIVPSLVYWILTTLTILPIFRLEQKGPFGVEVKTGILRGLCTFYFICLILLILFYWQDFLVIYAYGDYGELRAMVLRGDFIETKYSGLLGMILTFVRTVTSLATIMIPVFFLIIIKKEPRIYATMAILGSLCSIILGFLSLDRSNVIWWLLIMGWCFVFFKENLSKHDLKDMRPYLFTLFSSIFFYFAIITISKFGEAENGSGMSLISYAGSSYPNFCYFWDNFQAKEFSTKMLFPMTHHFIFNDYSGIVGLQELRSSESNIDFGVFYTYLGNFLIDGGHLEPFIFVILYLILFIPFVNRIKHKNLSFPRFFILFCFSMIPATGVISYFFSSPYSMFTAFFLFFLISFLNNIYTSKIKPI